MLSSSSDVRHPSPLPSAPSLYAENPSHPLAISALARIYCASITLSVAFSSSCTSLLPSKRIKPTDRHHDHLHSLFLCPVALRVAPRCGCTISLKDWGEQTPKIKWKEFAVFSLQEVGTLLMRSFPFISGWWWFKTKTFFFCATTQENRLRVLKYSSSPFVRVPQKRDSHRVLFMRLHFGLIYQHRFFNSSPTSSSFNLTVWMSDEVSLCLDN